MKAAHSRWPSGTNFSKPKVFGFLLIGGLRWMAERRKRLDAAGIAQAVALFTQLPVTLDPETNDRARRRNAGACAPAHALRL